MTGPAVLWRLAPDKCAQNISELDTLISNLDTFAQVSAIANRKDLAREVGMEPPKTFETDVRGPSSGRRGTGTARAMNMPARQFETQAEPRFGELDMIAFLEDFGDELEHTTELFVPNPVYRMALFLMRAHLEGRIVTPTALIGASRVPYATATRRLKDMIEAGMIEQRPRTATGKSVSLHPSPRLADQWTALSGRVRRLAEDRFGGREPESRDYYFGGSYMTTTQLIPPIQVLPEPLKPVGGVRVLVHGDPTFMVMHNLKRQFEQVIGCPIHQRAFSIDRLRDEGLRNAERKVSRYDIVAVDLPWVGEFAARGVLMPLDEAMDLARLDPADFHTAGWAAAHWGGRPYAVPSQTTPELLFYRRDLFAEAGLEPPTTHRPRCSPPPGISTGPSPAATASPGTPPAAPRWGTR